jgi:hypothetical protein
LLLAATAALLLACVHGVVGFALGYGHLWQATAAGLMEAGRVLAAVAAGAASDAVGLVSVVVFCA